MKYTFKFEQDVMKIKKILDQSKRRAMVIDVAKAHGVSDKTVYRHLNKRVPGVRKVRKDSGKDKTPVTKKEASIVSEVVKAGNTRKEAKEVLMKKLDKKISNRKLSKITSKIKTEPVTEETTPSNFGSAALQIIRKLLELDLVAPDSGLKYEYNEVKFFITKKQLEDIALILATAYNNSVTGDSKKLKGDHIAQLKAQMFYDLCEMRRVAKDSRNNKEYEGVVRMLDKLEEKNVEMTPDFYVLEKCMKELKPEITREQVIALIKKNSNG